MYHEIKQHTYNNSSWGNEVSKWIAKVPGTRTQRNVNQNNTSLPITEMSRGIQAIRNHATRNSERMQDEHVHAEHRHALQRVRIDTNKRRKPDKGGDGGRKDGHIYYMGK